MKKLIVSALALTLISFGYSQAQTGQQEATQQEVAAQKQSTVKKESKEDKVAVKPEDLPEGIKKTIKSDDFAGWTVKKAFLVTEDNKQYYELQVAKGSDNARVKLDKDGNNVG